MTWFDHLYTFFTYLHPFMIGANFSLNLVAAVLFFRFYRRSRERLFLFFAAAFAILAINRLAFMILNPPDPESTPLYLIRLVAFLLILFAILDKNRGRGARRS